MPIEWAGLGPELLLAPRPNAAPSRSGRSSSASYAKRSARAGWPPANGCRRRGRMAAELGISRGLVLECYSQLQAEGFLTSRTGFGDAGRGRRARARARRRGRRALTAPPTGPVPARGSRSTSCPGRPRPDELPARRLGAGDARQLSRTRPPTELGYGDPRGTDALRQVLAGYLRRVRGAVADAGPDRDLRRLRPGHQPRASLARRRRSPAGGDRGPGRRRLPRDLLRASESRRFRSRSTSAGSTSTPSPRPMSAR